MSPSKRDPRQSYTVNGKFQLPELPPNCFGIAVHYALTVEDIERGQAAYGDDFTDTDGEPLTVGQVVECGQYTVRNTAKQKRSTGRSANETRAVKSSYREAGKDTIRLADCGKPASQERIAALAAYYASNAPQDVESCEENPSPWGCDLAVLVSKSAIAVEQDFDHAE